MEWVVDVDVGAWTWVWSIQLLVHWTSITAVEGSVHSFFLNDFVLDVILLSFVFVLAGTRVLSISLPRVRSLSFMLPELTSLGLRQE